MDKNSKTYGRPLVVDKYSTDHNGEDVNTKGVCPAALGSKDEQPAAYSPDTQLFYVPTNHVCMLIKPKSQLLEVGIVDEILDSFQQRARARLQRGINGFDNGTCCQTYC